MKNISVLLFAMVLTLTACGGGDEGGSDDLSYYTPPSYGSIATNSITKAAAISSDYGGQSAANSNAISTCGSGCTTALEFGSYMCGALARGSNGIFGWASNSRKSNAEGGALSQCTTRGGVNCAIVLSACNSS